jgi:nucleoside-diphosphate-sugar epimerase
VVGIDNLLTGSERNLGHLAGEPRFRFVWQDVTTPFFIDDPVDLVLHFVYGPRMRANNGRVIPPFITAAVELAQIVAALVGRTPRVVHLPLPEDDSTRRRPDIRKAQARLGWSPTVSLEDGLRRTIEWLADVTVPGTHRVAV